MLVVDIPTQILPTILFFTILSFRLKLKVYINIHTEKGEKIYDELIIFAKVVRQYVNKVKKVSQIHVPMRVKHVLKDFFFFFFFVSSPLSKRC